MEKQEIRDNRHQFLANLLEKEEIVYQYQPMLLVEGDSTGFRVKPFQSLPDFELRRDILTPHFYLPDFFTAINFPSVGDYSSEPNRNVSIVTQLQRLYDSHSHHLIQIPPEAQDLHQRYEILPREMYKEFVFNSIEKFLEGKLKFFKSKYGRL